MKKFLSCVLAMALVLSLMSTTVFADDTKNVVGTFGGGDIDDGLTSFTDENVANNTHEITVNFTASTDNGGQQTGTTMEDRYAIDITYSDLVIDLTQMKTNVETDEYLDVKYIWDVNIHEYVIIDGEGNTITKDDNSGDVNTAIQINAFMITNHSSKPIYYKGELVNEVSSCMNMDFESTNIKNQEVGRATVGSATYGPQEVIAASPLADETWLDAINGLLDSGKQTGSTIGSITVTFSMAEITA